MTRKYNLVYNFDVWGDKEEYWVNDSTSLGEVEIPDNATNKQICNLIKEKAYWFDPDLRKVKIEEPGDFIEVKHKKGDMPYFTLNPIY